MNDEPEWVELRRFDDALDCDIATNFLRDHGVTVALRGNSGATSVLNRFTTVFDMRLTVPAAEFERACEVLTALSSPDENLVGGFGGPGGPGGPWGPAADLAEPGALGPVAAGPRAPYRDVRLVDDAEEPLVRRRSGAAAAFVAVFIPIGAGHFYARHNAAGQVFCGAIAGSFLGGVLGGVEWFSLAASLMVLADSVGSVMATGRYNAGRVPSPGRQMAGAAAACLGCALVAWMVRGGR